MTTDSMVFVAWILTIWGLLAALSLWILALRKTQRLERMLVEILVRYGFDPDQIGALIDGYAQLDVKGGRQ